MTIGEVLRQARIDAHLTQEEVAFRAELDRTYISMLERDLKSPTLTTFFRLCQAVGQKPEEVIKQMQEEQTKERCVLLINEITHEAIIEDPEQRIKIASETGRDYIQMRDIDMLKERYELRQGEMHGIVHRLYYCPKHQASQDDKLAAKCMECGKRTDVTTVEGK